MKWQVDVFAAFREIMFDRFRTPWLTSPLTPPGPYK